MAEFEFRALFAVDFFSKVFVLLAKTGTGALWTIDEFVLVDFVADETGSRKFDDPFLVRGEFSKKLLGDEVDESEFRVYPGFLLSIFGIFENVVSSPSIHEGFAKRLVGGPVLELVVLSAVGDHLAF